MNKVARKAVIFCFAIAFAIYIGQEINPAFTTLKTRADVINSSDTFQSIDLGQCFQQLGIEGSIVIYDAQNDKSYQHNPQRNQTAFLPASTFKIFNSLISLETGIIDDEIAILTWDGIPRLIPEWNRDLNMRQAFKFSAVWFYQVLVDTNL